jgi:serine/threonine-protein kinase
MCDGHAVVQAGTVVGSGFVLEALLGEGASGEVWRGRRGREVVAVKLLHRERWADERAASRFRQEIALLERLNHPAIPRLWEAELGFVVMDLAPGLPLSRWLLERSMRGEWPEGGHVRHILAVLAQALDHAHAQGVVHRDLKPANVCFDEATGRVTLLDLGLAKQLEGPGLVETTVGRVVGTPYYLAPEQIAAEVVGPATDVFALSTMAFELLTLRRAWARDEQDAPRPLHARVEAGDPWNTPLAVMQRIRAGLRPRAAAVRVELPAGVDGALGRGWAVQPEERSASAGAWVALLERAWAGEVVGPSGVPAAVTQAPCTTPAAVRAVVARDDAELTRTVLARVAREHLSRDTLVVAHEADLMPTAATRAAPELGSQDTPVVTPAVLACDTAESVAAMTMPAHRSPVVPAASAPLDPRTSSAGAWWRRGPAVLALAMAAASVLLVVRWGTRGQPHDHERTELSGAASPSVEAPRATRADPASLAREVPRTLVPEVRGDSPVARTTASVSTASPAASPTVSGRPRPPVTVSPSPRTLAARASASPSPSATVLSASSAPRDAATVTAADDALTRALTEASAHPEDGARLAAVVEVIQARSARLPVAQRQAIDSAARRALFGGGVERARAAAELLRKAEAAR